MEILNRSAEEFENDQTLEAMWAMKAFEHAEIYFNVCAENTDLTMTLMAYILDIMFCRSKILKIDSSR
jgi:hypothetical protein